MPNKFERKLPPQYTFTGVVSETVKDFPKHALVAGLTTFASRSAAQIHNVGMRIYERLLGYDPGWIDEIDIPVYQDIIGPIRHGGCSEHLQALGEVGSDANLWEQGIHFIKKVTGCTFNAENTQMVGAIAAGGYCGEVFVNEKEKHGVSPKNWLLKQFWGAAVRVQPMAVSMSTITTLNRWEEISSTFKESGEYSSGVYGTILLSLLAGLDNTLLRANKTDKATELILPTALLVASTIAYTMSPDVAKMPLAGFHLACWANWAEAVTEYVDSVDWTDLPGKFADDVKGKFKAMRGSSFPVSNKTPSSDDISSLVP